MSRLASAFAQAKQEKRKALVIYLTAGDPDAETGRKLVLAAHKAGADIIELGVPWSDPSADGVAIQGAMRRAIAAGGGMRASLELCRRVRAEAPNLPLVLFGYANPIFVRGPEAFAGAAHDAGADAVLCVDWPPDEASELTSALAKKGLDFVPLLAPTSTPKRVKAIGAAASGFIYYVSLTGITGRFLDDAAFEGVRRHVAEIRELTGNRLPVVVGFGIATAEQVRSVALFADGVVVGSAAVKVIQEATVAGKDPVPALERFVSGLRAAL